jgi:hypothetical protein
MATLGKIVAMMPVLRAGFYRKLAIREDFTRVR